MAKDQTVSERIAALFPILEAIRTEIPMLFALRQVDECVATRDALRNLRTLVATDTDDEMSVVGVFDTMCDMGAQNTWGPSLKELQRVVPKRAYTKRDKAETPAPAESPAAEESPAETPAS